MPETTNVDDVIKEFEEVRDDLKDILMDIRVFIMEGLTPIPNDLERARLREELDSDRR